MTGPEKIAYLKGLTDGVTSRMDKDMAKLFTTIVDCLSDLQFAEMKANVLEGKFKSLSRDVKKLEDDVQYLYDAVDVEDDIDDYDFNFDNDDDDDEDDYDYYAQRERKADFEKKSSCSGPGPWCAGGKICGTGNNAASDEPEDDEDDSFEFDDVDDTHFYEITCLNCGETIIVDESIHDAGGVQCPKCGEMINFDGDEMEVFMAAPELDDDDEYDEDDEDDEDDEYDEYDEDGTDEVGEVKVDVRTDVEDKENKEKMEVREEKETREEEFSADKGDT